MRKDAGYRIGGQTRCLLCAALHGPLLYRSAKTALVVGTILVVINVGPSILAGGLAPAGLWRIPLNYLVPFCVATWGALSNARPDRR
jgi:hypothetical protein